MPDRSIQLVIVDDASTDGSPDLVRSLARPEIDLIALADNRGAGYARNRGFSQVRGRYTLFFDADDEVNPASLSHAVTQLDATRADVAFLPYRYRRWDDSSRTDMNEVDRAVWRQYVPPSGQRVVTLDEAPRLLGFSNYPWNKLLRTEHYQQAGLRFGETMVHNDVLGHWMTLIHARTIMLLDALVGTHIVSADGANLSRRMGLERLQLFDALDETYDFLAANPPARNRFAHHYWDFALRVSEWALSRIADEFHDDATARLQQHILRVNLADLTHMRVKRNPSLADRLHRRALA